MSASLAEFLIKPVAFFIADEMYKVAFKTTSVTNPVFKTNTLLYKLEVIKPYLDKLELCLFKCFH